ncbi:MAG: beta-galactosidase [Myxococcales bacterium]|nr:beta-galactosidase [Myxococcales bacterium]
MRLLGSGFEVEGQRHPIHSGALHYFRLEPQQWRPALESLRALGLNMVESYVPWGVHQRPDGDLDFGQHDPRLNLRGFLELAQELGLWVFLRPGPHVNAELSYFGLPRSVVLDTRNQALSARGRPLLLPAVPRFFPVPSYASRHFRAQVAQWYRALGPVLAPYRAPEGPLALLQVDNEASFYFRDAPYDSDYHPDAIADFRSFLQQRHGDLTRLERAWGTQFQGFDAIEPPRRFDPQAPGGLPRHLDWARFQGVMLRDALADMARSLGEAGLDGIPTVHNLPMGDLGLPVTLASLEGAVDAVGLDYYHGRDGLEAVRRRTQRLAAHARPALAPELGLGAPPWFGARSIQDALQSALCALAFGLRGFNLYMTVDRDRWVGAPVAADGSLRPSAAGVARLVRAVRDCRLHQLERRAAVAISLPGEYAALSRATHTLGACSPSTLELMGLPASAGCRRDPLGFAQPIQHAWRAVIDQLDAALCDLQLPFIYLDGDADLERYPELQLICAPSFEFADATRWQQLEAFARRGGSVIYGPGLPHMDADLQPHDFAPPGGSPQADLDDRAAVDEVLRSRASELGLVPEFPVFPRPLIRSVHELDGEPQVLFIVHPGREDCLAEQHLPRPMILHDIYADERFSGQRTVSIPMPGRSCRLLLLQEASEPTQAGDPRRSRPPAARAERS